VATVVMDKYINKEGRRNVVMRSVCSWWDCGISSCTLSNTL